VPPQIRIAEPEQDGATREVLDNGKVRPVVQFAFAARPVDIAILLHRNGGYRLPTWPLSARVMLESLQAGDRMSIHSGQASNVSSDRSRIPIAIAPS
jgi:hypothetical protein